MNFDQLPFSKFDYIQTVFPSDNELESLNFINRRDNLIRLLASDLVGLESELGCKVLLPKSEILNGKIAKWYIGPSQCFVDLQQDYKKSVCFPELRVDRKNGLLFSDGKDFDQVMETFSYLRVLYRNKSNIISFPICRTIEEAIDRIVEEVGNTYPYFKIKKLNWQSICDKHIPLVLKTDDKIYAIQTWLAELNDAHTWLRFARPRFYPKIDVIEKDHQVVVINVEKDSPAWCVGIRDGYILDVDDVQYWWKKTPSTLHAKSWVIGNQLLASETKETKVYQAKSPDGSTTIKWQETPELINRQPYLTWKILDKNIGYIKISCFIIDVGLESKLIEALLALKYCDKLIVDLKDNPGGNITLAYHLKGYFLNKDRLVGWMIKSLPDGSLSEKRPIYGIKMDHEAHWSKDVEFLINERTYSAAEDFLLGLSEQENVSISGSPSGGGSGRSRIIRIFEDYNLFISTAITYEPDGWCIENQGIRIKGK